MPRYHINLKGAPDHLKKKWEKAIDASLNRYEKLREDLIRRKAHLAKSKLIIPPQ